MYNKKNPCIIIIYNFIRMTCIGLHCQHMPLKEKCTKSEERKKKVDPRTGL